MGPDTADMLYIEILKLLCLCCKTLITNMKARRGLRMALNDLRP